MNIPLVVAAYDRVAPLQRLLGSIVRAHYDRPVKLIISIDGGGSASVHEAAALFTWPHGAKQVIHHPNNLGLRRHIISCGDLSAQYDGIILLEDDLYVSPWFYSYAVSAAEYYAASSDIAGIALYSPRFNECARLPFYPYDDGGDIFFMQLACSWGQLWLRAQWSEFAAWYAKNSSQEVGADPFLPLEIRQWPNSSWKKFFIKFMVERDKYFVYPRDSYTTNFGDMGSHHTGTLLYQVPLRYGRSRGYSFVDFARSLVKYDAFGEMIPESLQEFCPHLRGKECVVDLYGIKERDCLSREYVLTSKKCDHAIFSYGKLLKPIESNIIENVPGNDLYLTTPGKISGYLGNDFREYIYSKCADTGDLKYFYNISDVNFYHFAKDITKFRNISEDAINKVQQLKKYKVMSEQAVNKVQRLKKQMLKERNENLEKLAIAQKSIDLVRNSMSYRIGNKIVRPFSCLRVKKKSLR